MSGGLPQRGSSQRRQRRVQDQLAGSAANNETSNSGQTASSHKPVDLVEHRSAAEEGYKFEYLDHPADVQLHAWGQTLEEAFAGAALAMFNYMTPLSGVKADPQLARTVHAEGHDLHSLLFGFLDELLFIFSTELMVFRSINITKLDRKEWTISATGEGQRFDRERHAVGTEIKAITYSAMQIREEASDAEVFVIVDI